MKTFTPVTSRIETITRSLRLGPLHNVLCPLATMLKQGLALPLILIGTALLAQPCAATPFQWEYTGSLNFARYGHTATLLSDGTVLVVGGRNGHVFFASAELYDPATGNWTATGSLTTGRFWHTATLLAEGKVLAAGGYAFGSISGTLASAELYDPATGMWTPTGSLHTARDSHTATLLPGGEVLVVGGWDIDGFSVGTAELYNPATGTWTTIAGTYRVGHTATILADGRVLVAGGWDQELEKYLDSVMIYDQATGNFTPTASLAVARVGHVATLLPSGKVLVAGGYSGSTLASSEIYDPATGLWTTTGNLITARENSDSTLLPSGQILIAGGVVAMASAELYDPATGTWTGTGSLNTGRDGFSLSSLPTGKALVAGGLGDTGALASAELYDPGIEPTPTPTPTATPTATPTPTPTATPTPTPTPVITLNAAGRKVQGTNTVRLTWSGATSPKIDIYRDGGLIARMLNTGTYTESTGTSGRTQYTYQVCEAGTSVCSDSARVRFRH